MNLEIAPSEAGPRGGVIRWGVYTKKGKLVFSSPDRVACVGFIAGVKWAKS